MSRPQSCSDSSVKLPTSDPLLRHDDENDYEGLSVIDFTLPKSPIHSAAVLRAPDVLDDSFTPKLTSTNSSSSLSLSTAPKSVQLPKARGEPKRQSSGPVSSFFSTLTRGWSQGMEHGTRDIVEESPRTIVASPRWLPRRGKPVDGKAGRLAETVMLRRALFDSIDVEDAREFDEFVEEKGRQRWGMPVLCLEGYGGEGEFAADVWVLMHNTVRRELFDLFEIVGIIRKRFLAMKMEDMYNLRKWWRFFGAMWREFGAHERERIDPVVEQICSVDGRGDVLKKRLRGLREMREWLGLKIEETTGYVEEFEKIGKPGRALSLICRSVESFAAKAVLYFGGMERLLPSMLEGYYQRQSCKEIESALVGRLRRTDYFGEMVVAMVRWMGADVRTSWMEEHLFWGERQAMERFERKYEICHGCIVVHFKDRLHSADSL